MITADDPVIGLLASRRRMVYRTGEPVAPVRGELPPGDIGAGDAVQRVNADFWSGQARRIVGRKTGITSEAVQRQLGVSQSDFGALFDDMRVPEGGTFPRRASERYSIPGIDLLLEDGRRRMVGGQDDLIADLALDLLQKGTA